MEDKADLQSVFGGGPAFPEIAVKEAIAFHKQPRWGANRWKA
ncbi:MAG: hypothetical protein OXG60_03200 [Chloroflexi bacterium]|nr:hypothetical protein [Chloroflexota bacterium]